jgi:flagellar hook assembly protein FlgD
MTKSKSRQSLIKVPVENLDLENSQEQSPSVLWLVLNEGTPTELTKEAEGSMGKESKLPTNFYLAQPKPNPFGTGTSIGYGLPQASDVKLSVFDASGSLVRTLVEISQTAGLYSVIWNGKDNTNRQLANGIYFIRMQAGTNKFLRKAILLKQ